MLYRGGRINWGTGDSAAFQTDGVRHMAVMTAEENPPIISIGGQPSEVLPPSSEGDWFIGQTKSKQERAFAHALMARGISYFLPMQFVTVRSGGQSLPGMRVLFPGYVFFRTDVDGRYAATDTRRLWGMIEVRHPERLQGELTNLLLGIGNGGFKYDRFADYVPGRKCVIVTGAMRGQEGEILYRPDHSPELQLRVAMLGSAVFRIKAEDVELLPD